MKSKLLLTLIALTNIATAQLSGNYTINSALPTGGTNYQSFRSFADSININGVSGNVIASVVPGSGPYVEQVVFDSIPGSSASATVTIEGNNEIITALTDSTNRHIIRLKDIQYFTINNLRVNRDTNSTSGFYGIHIYNTGHHIILSACTVDMTGSSSTLIGGYVASGSETSILTTGDFNNLSFTGNRTTGGGYGISVFGLAFPLATNIVISGNTLLDFHSNGIYLRETDGTIVKNNSLNKTTTNITSVNAIQVAQNANQNTSIYGNFIKVGQINNGSVTFRGIYLFNGAGHKVYNNVIHDVNLTSGNFTGIEVRTAGMAPQIYFNTISIDNASGSTGNLYGIKEELSSTNSILRNNLISITQPTTGMKAGLVLGTLTPLNTFDSDYNDIYVPSGNTALKNPTTPVFYPTLNDWQTASMRDSHSIATDPIFFSLAVPQPTNLAMNNAGIPIAWITDDVALVMRDINTPDIGAYEFPSTVSVDDELTSAHAIIYPTVNNGTFTVRVDNGQLMMNNVEVFNSLGEIIHREIIGSMQQEIRLRNPMTGIYFVRIRSGEKIVTKKIAVNR
jgi:parallel beta-helix repeat protein